MDYLFLRQQNENQKTVIPMALFWLFAVAAFFAVNYYGAVQERQLLALFSARSYFKLILVTRQWNSRHSGVYVPVTGTTRPNPYIDEPERELHIDANADFYQDQPCLHDPADLGDRRGIERSPVSYDESSTNSS